MDHNKIWGAGGLDLPKAVECKALPILFADDTNILLTSPNNTQMNSDLNFVFEQLNKWFKSNHFFFKFWQLTLFNFFNKCKCTSDTQIKYKDKQLSIANETKFLGLFINKNLPWKTHIECIKSKLRKLSLLCYEVSKTICNNKYLENDSLILLPLCNDLWFVNLRKLTRKIFRLQKKIVRIMTGCRSTDSCTKLFINLEILPLPFQYILSLLLFMLTNKNQFLVNSEIHHIDTRQHANFHQPSVNVTK